MLMFVLGCGGTQPRVDDSQRERTFNQQELIVVIQGARGRIRSCYQAALRSDPNLGGRLEVALTLEANGSASGVHVVNSGALVDAVGECVVGVVRTFQVEHGPQDGPLSYTFPFVFEPQ